MSKAAIKPAANEYAEYYDRYVSLVPEGDVVRTLATQLEETLELLRSIPEERAGHRYGPDKWSIRELVCHVVDTERIFAYRALRIARGDKTPLASPDHWQAMQITDAAIFYARLTKWDEHFDHLPVHTIISQLYFRLAFEPQTLNGFPGNFTVDIGDTLDDKLASIACYETQFPPAKAHVFDRVKGAALIAGAAAGFRAGEAFVSVRPIGSIDLVKTALGQV